MHILDATRALMFDAHLPSHLWADTLLTATYLINQMPSPTTHNKSPYQLLHHRKPYYLHLCVFGCHATHYYPLPLATNYNLAHFNASSSANPQTQNATNVYTLQPAVPILLAISSSMNHASHTSQLLISQPPIQNNSTSQPLLLTLASIPPSLHPPPPHLTIPIPVPTTLIHSSTEGLQPTTDSTPSSTSTSVPRPPPTVHPPSHPVITRTRTRSLKHRAIFNLLHSSNSPNPPTSFSQASKSVAWCDAMSQEFIALQQVGT